MWWWNFATVVVQRCLTGSAPAFYRRPYSIASQILQSEDRLSSGLLGCAALVWSWGLSSIKVRTGISLRIIRVASGAVFLVTGGADSRRKSPRGWSCTGSRVAVYVGSLPFERWDILRIPLGSVASECQ